MSIRNPKSTASAVTLSCTLAAVPATLSFDDGDSGSDGSNSSKGKSDTEDNSSSNCSGQ